MVRWVWMVQGIHIVSCIMVGLLATLGAEGKPLPTMVSLVVTSHETSAFFSVSWGCFATILRGIVVVRMSEEVHVNPQLIQESPWSPWCSQWSHSSTSP